MARKKLTEKANIPMSAEMYGKLEALAVTEEISVASLVRRACRDFLNDKVSYTHSAPRRTRRQAAPVAA